MMNALRQRAPSANQPASDRWFTWPNVVTSVRIIGSPGLVMLALGEEPMWLGAAAVLLVGTEWLDGFLARHLHEESTTGARLDTIADAVFYSSLLAAIVLLYPQPILREIYWIGAAVGSYAGSWLASFSKFRRLPSYHTWAAKGVWVLVGIGIVCLLANWAAWPFRLAMTCVTLANIEAIAITLVLERCRVNVPTFWHAMRMLPRSR